MPELLRIFIDVLVPVFGVAAVGYAVARITGLDHRPMGTVAYWVLVPAFIFRTLSDPAALDGPVVSMMAATVISVSVVWFMMAGVLHGKSGDRRVIDSMAAAMGNVGNLGFPIVLFALGRDALPSAVIHFIAATLCIFGFGVSASVRLRNGAMSSTVRRVIATPAIFVVPLGFAMAATESTLPIAMDRLVGLLADAMIPVMLLTLGIQLASSRLQAGWRRLGTITVAKLVVSPLAFLAVAAIFGLEGFARDTGLLLAAMPTAVLVSLIGIEFDLEAEVASAAILLTSMVSLGTLSVVLALL